MMILMLVMQLTQKEAYMLHHVLVLPAYYNVPYCLTKINVYSKMNAMFGSQNEKMKNWETNANGYTTEEMGSNRCEHNKSNHTFNRNPQKRQAELLSFFCRVY